MSIAERAELRQREAQPLLASMHEWLKATRVTVGNGGWGHRKGDRLQPEALAGSAPLRRKRQTTDRQQPGRERHPADLPGQEELALYGFRTGGQVRRSDPEPAGHCGAQRARSGHLIAYYFGEASKLPQQRHRFAASASPVPPTGSRHVSRRRRDGRLRNCGVIDHLQRTTDGSISKRYKLPWTVRVILRKMGL
jgi:hypothetical protein